MWYEDITIRGFVQAVYDMIRNALVKREQRPLIRLYAYLQSGQSCDLVSPAAGSVNHDFTFDIFLSARYGISYFYTILAL
jgi:hypothetical protein